MDIFQRGKELELERKLRSIENQVGITHFNFNSLTLLIQ